MAIEIPHILIQTIVYSCVTYSMMGFEGTASKFSWFVFFSFFTNLYFTFYGMMTTALSPNHHIAAISSSAFYAIWNLFSGFLVPLTVSLQSREFYFSSAR